MLKLKSVFIFTIASIILVSFIPKKELHQPPFYTTNTHWADSVFKTLTPDERIAQLFMVAAYSNKDKVHVNELKKLITARDA